MEMLDQQRSLKRDKRIDILRGIAVFLVIWGHVVQGLSADSLNFFQLPVFKCIYSFHMPLFMLISGYLFYYSSLKRHLKEIIKNRILRLLCPIFIWNTVGYGVQIIVECVFEGSWSLSFGTYVDALKNLWFLWAVLACSLILAVIVKFLPEKLQLLGIIIASPLVLFFPYRWQIVWMYPYFVLGYYFSKYKRDVIRKSNFLQYVSVALYVFLLFSFEEKHYIYISEISPLHSSYGFAGQIWIDIYRWGIGILGSITVIVLLNKIMKQNIRHGLDRVFVWMEDLGQNSLQIYVLQSILLEYLVSFGYSQLVKILGKNYLVQNVILFQFVITPLIAITLSGIFCLFSKKIKKLKFSKVLGFH